MSLPLQDKNYTPVDAQIVKAKSWKMFGHYCCGFHDCEELEQTLAHHVSQANAKHPYEGDVRRKFVNRVAKNKLLNEIEHRTARKRSTRHTISIDDENKAHVLDGMTSSSDLNLRLSVKQVLDKLPEDLWEVAHLLQQSYTAREIEIKLGLTRAQVRTRLQHLKQIFHDAKLDPNFKEEE